MKSWVLVIKYVYTHTCVTNGAYQINSSNRKLHEVLHIWVLFNQTKYMVGSSKLLHSKGIQRSKLLIKGSLATYLVAAPYLHIHNYYHKKVTRISKGGFGHSIIYKKRLIEFSHSFTGQPNLWDY